MIYCKKHKSFSHKKLFLSFILLQFMMIMAVNAQVLKDKTVESVMEQKKEYQKLNPKIEGFKIQLYNGNESEAYLTKTKFMTVFPDIKVEISYKAPEWRVQVGNYRTRLEADQSLLKIKEQFPGSLVVRAKINP